VSDNIKTILYAAVMAAVVALTLAFLKTYLAPIQKVQEDRDKKINILKAVEYNDFMDAKEEYNKRIEEVVIDYKGNVKEGINPFDLENSKKQAKKLPEAERSYPVYVYTSDTRKKKYIIPMTGNGLWDEISGFMAIDDDFNTIHGASFAHVGETPGLGAEITENWFQSQFAGKKLKDPSGEMAFDVLKGRGNDLNEYEVDGITGATITADGVDNMIQKEISFYETYFEQQEKAMAQNSGGTVDNPALRAPAVRKMSTNLFSRGARTLANQINFQTGSAIVTKESMKQIQALVAYLSNNPAKRVEIIVNDKADKDLSQRRAENIYGFALQQGARQSQLAYKGDADSGSSNRVEFNLLN